MTIRRLTLVLTAAAVVWAVASFAAMTFGTLVNWPDYVHTDFGVPFIFATHTTSTLAGAADTWVMDMGALASDLAFWLAGMIVIVLVNLARNPKPGPLTPQGTT